MTDPDETLRDADLDGSGFECCPNVDPRPFKCADCGHLMVYCDECDSVYPELRASGLLAFTGANGLDPARPALFCPACGAPVPWDFRRRPAYGVTRDEWVRAGLARRLRAR